MKGQPKSSMKHGTDLKKKYSIKEKLSIEDEG